MALAPARAGDTGRGWRLASPKGLATEGALARATETAAGGAVGMATAKALAKAQVGTPVKVTGLGSGLASAGPAPRVLARVRAPAVAAWTALGQIRESG